MLYALLPLGLLACALLWPTAPGLSVGGVIFTAACVIALAERIRPYRADWTPAPRRLGLDLFHTLVSSGGTSRLVEATLLAAAATALAAVTPGWWTGPLLLQLVVALLIGELGAYTAHRLCHTTRWGWRIHAVHHSAESLHLLASGRTHPLNTALVFTFQSLPLVLLGAPGPVLALVAVFTGINGLLQHANVDANPGPLAWFVSTNRHHRWHHSTDLAQGNTNFGNNLIVWDRLLGTCHEAPGGPEQVGIAGSSIPERLWAHWLTPWRLDRWS